MVTGAFLKEKMFIDDCASRGWAHQFHQYQRPFRKLHRNPLITADFLLKHDVGDILCISAVRRSTPSLDALCNDIWGYGPLFV